MKFPLVQRGCGYLDGRSVLSKKKEKKKKEYIGQKKIEPIPWRTEYHSKKSLISIK